MGYKFERGRIEPCLDKSVKLEIVLYATKGDVEGEDPTGLADHSVKAANAWADCKLAHRHWWDVCPVRELFNDPRADLGGKSLKEDLLARFLAQQKPEPLLVIPKKKAVKA